MSDLAEKMKRTVSARPEPGAAAGRAATKAKRVEPEAFLEAPKRYPRRVTLDLDDSDFRALKDDAYAGEVPLAELLRGLVAAYRDDEKLKRQTLHRAREARERP